MEIMNVENIYIENKPKYIIIWDDETKKSYTLIVEKFDKDEYNIYYNQNIDSSIKDKINKIAIQAYNE